MIPARCKATFSLNEYKLMLKFPLSSLDIASRVKLVHQGRIKRVTVDVVAWVQRCEATLPQVNIVE